MHNHARTQKNKIEIKIKIDLKIGRTDKAAKRPFQSRLQVPEGVAVALGVEKLNGGPRIEQRAHLR